MQELMRGEATVFLGGKARKIVMRAAAARQFQRLTGKSFERVLANPDQIGFEEISRFLECGFVYLKDPTIDEEKINEWIDGLSQQDPPEENSENFITLSQKLFKAIGSGAPGVIEKKSTVTTTTPTATTPPPVEIVEAPKTQADQLASFLAEAAATS